MPDYEKKLRTTQKPEPKEELKKRQPKKIDIDAEIEKLIAELERKTDDQGSDDNA